MNTASYSLKNSLGEEIARYSSPSAAIRAVRMSSGPGASVSYTLPRREESQTRIGRKTYLKTTDSTVLTVQNGSRRDDYYLTKSSLSLISEAEIANARSHNTAGMSQFL